MAAVAANGVIGRTNEVSLPWKIPAEMKWFRNTTINNVVIMGWNTFASLGYCPLPRRENIVITHRDLRSLTEWDDRDNLSFANNVQDSLLLSQLYEAEVFVIGGRQIYKQFIELRLIDRMLISHLKEEFEGNIKFPLHDFTGWIGRKIVRQEEFNVVEYTKCN